MFFLFALYSLFFKIFLLYILSFEKKFIIFKLKKTSLAHLTQIKKTMDDIKNLENKFYRKSLNYVKEEKVEIDKEQTDISKILVSIEVKQKKINKLY
jgi:hypothetical protein